MRKKSILTYSGRLSTDTDPRYVKPENHIAAQNVYGTPKENGGTLFVAPGAVKVSTDLSSTHTLIGTFEEKTTNKIYYLVYVPASPDRIYVYDPLDQSSPNGVSRELCRFTGLDLNTQYLAQGKIVGGKYLIWTESNMIKNTLEGNGIKKINLERADVNKRFTYKIAVTQVSEANEDHLYQLYDVNGTPLSSAVFYSPTEPEDTIQDRINAIASALDALPNITAVAYKNYVLVNMGTVGRRFNAYTDALTVQTGLTDWPDAKYNGQALFCWADNHYPLETTRQMFDLCKRPFPCAPFHEFQENPDVLATPSDLRNGAWQFIVRIHFVDGEVSAWSEPSIIASDRYIQEQEISFHNGLESWTWDAIVAEPLKRLIVGRYHDEMLSDETQLALISDVEIAVRPGTTDVYYQLDKYPIEDVIASKFEFTFKNDAKGAVVSSDDAFTDIETQVLKKFDFVPRETGSVGLIAEENGNSKIVLGSPLEGYDNVLKADCSIEFEFTEDWKTIRKLHHRLKELGVYRMGIEYIDDFTRTSDVIPIAEFQVPRQGDVLNIFDFVVNVPKITINHVPPIWATRYRLVRTKDLKHKDFFQFATLRDGSGVFGDLVNVRAADTDLTVWEQTTFELSTHTLIKLPIDIGRTAIDQYHLFNEDENIGGFQPAKGDKIRLMRAMLYATSDYFGRYIALGNSPEFEIIGIHINIETGRKSVIVNKITQGTVNGTEEIPGVYIWDIFRPTSVDDAVYSETGNCFDIINPGTNNRYHAGNIQDQDGTDPAIVEFYGGDIMWTSGNGYKYPSDPDKILLDIAVMVFDMSHSLHNLETKNYNLETDNVASSMGRGNLEDAIKEAYVFNTFRHSGIYIPNSLINNVNAFRPIDVVTLNSDYGPISGLELSGNTLLAICFNKLQPIYINRQDILNVNNAGLLATSSKPFSFGSELRGDQGCQHKESILSNDGKVYAWDKRTGEVWRYDANGVNDIRTDMVTTFAEIGEYRKPHLINLDRVFTGFDRRRNIFFIYFQEINRDGITSCWMFNEDENGWKGTLTMTPQMMNMVHDKLISWKENQLYVHDGIGHIPANFHGVQTTPKVTKVFNPEPELIKIPWAATTQSGKLWSFPEIISPPSRHYATGQQSRIRSDRWRNISGKWSAAFLRDMNDTKAEFLEIPNLTTRAKTALLRGRVLRDNHFVITLQMDIPDNDTLFATEIEYSVDKKE